MTRSHRPLTGGLVLLTVAALIAGCGDGGDEAAASESVDVTLADYSVSPSPSSVTEGQVTFEVDNTAGQVHEFVVASTELGAEELPTGDDGDVAEEGATDLTVVDEIEDVEAGSTQQLTVDLQPGHYVLFCNLPGHYRQGMSTDFEVTG